MFQFLMICLSHLTWCVEQSDLVYKSRIGRKYLYIFIQSATYAILLETLQYSQISCLPSGHCLYQRPVEATIFSQHRHRLLV